jgi:hypothetical protein
MATEVTPDVGIASASIDSFTVVELPGGGASITYTEPTKKEAFEISGNLELSGASLTKSNITAELDKGKTAEVTLNTNFKSGKIETKGSGKIEVNVNSTFSKSFVKGGKKSDSVQFNARVKDSKISLGKGNDTVVFNQTTIFSSKGKTAVDLGKGGGKDVIEFKTEPNAGKVVVKNFDKKDTLIVGGSSIDYDNLKTNNVEFPNIKINLA